MLVLNMFPKSKELFDIGCEGVEGRFENDSDGERDDEREEVEAAPLGNVGADAAMLGAKALLDEAVLKRSMLNMSSTSRP